jgi:hypothetical protein
MALRYAVANGNWSNPATWDGGTLPTSADDVFANGFTVTINGTFTVITIRNSNNASPAIVTGGQFTFANGGNLTCTSLNAILPGSTTTPTLLFDLPSPNTATFTGTINSFSGGSNIQAIRYANSGTLNLIGNYATVNQNFNFTRVILVNGTGILNIIGNISSSVAGAPAGSTNNTIFCSTAATINITGNIQGSGATNTTHQTISSNLATINVTGNITGGTSTATGSCAINIGSGRLNVIGTLTAGLSGAIVSGGGLIIDITGLITSGVATPTILGTATTFVIVRGNVVNTDTFYAIYAGRVTIDDNVTSWQFKDSTNTITRTLYTAGVALGNPATSNVRLGTVYGASNELTGTLTMPIAATVLLGVLTDATTGTLLMTPADFWNYLISSGFTANSIGDRLQNAATVATTGDQIASYNI